MTVVLQLIPINHQTALVSFYEIQKKKTRLSAPFNCLRNLWVFPSDFTDVLPFFCAC